jgi:hypothetical protein
MLVWKQEDDMKTFRVIRKYDDGPEQCIEGPHIGVAAALVGLVLVDRNTFIAIVECARWARVVGIGNGIHISACIPNISLVISSLSQKLQ